MHADNLRAIIGMLRQEQRLHRRIAVPRRLDHQPHLIIAAQLALPPVAAFYCFKLHAGGKVRRQEGVRQPFGLITRGNRRQHQTQFGIHGKPHGVTKKRGYCHTINILNNTGDDNMLKRRQFIGATTGTLAALSLPLRAQTADKLTLWGPPVTPSVLLAIAARDGKAKDIRPFDVQVWRSPDQLRAGLLNGDIAASIVPSYVAANLYNQGKKIKLFNIMSEGLNYIAAPVTDGKPLITSLADLAGHSVVIPFKNDMPDLLLQILYKKAGLAFANIHYTATPPEALVMLLGGKVDCAMLPEPLLSLAQIKGKEKGKTFARALDVQQLWGEAFAIAPRVPIAGLLFTDDFISKNKDFIAVLNDDLTAAIAWSKAHPQETAELAAKYLPFPQDALAAAIPYSRFAAIPAASIDSELLNFYTELHALNAKITGGKVPDAGLFYR